MHHGPQRNVQQHPQTHVREVGTEGQTLGGVMSGQSPLVRTTSRPPSMGPAAIHVWQACVEKGFYLLSLP